MANLCVSFGGGSTVLLKRKWLIFNDYANNSLVLLATVTAYSVIMLSYLKLFYVTAFVVIVIFFPLYFQLTLFIFSVYVILNNITDCNNKHLNFTRCKIFLCIIDENDSRAT
jgi:hypothetical protein